MNFIKKTLFFQLQKTEIEYMYLEKHKKGI